ncbi:MAG TPA: cytochrome P450 [Mycobacteriales bacterium]|jgi:cytochrome P450|nr:cytochrome P450 [Mycobacteriales bacterium]
MSEPLPPEFVSAPPANPHPGNDRVRADGPVHRVDYPPGSDAYVVVDYETTLKAFGDRRLSKRLDNAPAWFREQTMENSPVIGNNMLLADAPEHTRLRNLVSRAFLPRRMEPLRPRIQEITDDLIDALPDSGEADLMAGFAFPLPLRVICEFLAVPPEDRPRFQSWGEVLSRDPSETGEWAVRRRAANAEVEQYFAKVLAHRREHPGEDLISELVRAADEEGTFTETELVSTLTLLVIAGHKTTANLVGNGSQALLRNPDQLARLRADPELVVPAIEEFLRFEGPVERGTMRVAVEDMQLGGVDIPKASFVHLSMCAADRDPDAFPDPHRLDIARTPNRHLGFGHGAHFCLGAPLARIEGQIAFTTLLRRLPGLELAVPADELRWVIDSSTSRGLQGLPVRIDGRLPR